MLRTIGAATTNVSGIQIPKRNVIPTTRPHCRLVRSGKYDKRKGGLFTKDEVRKLWQRSWKGKKAGDPFIVRGGYNCRHQWSFVNPNWYDANGNIKIQ